jgi:DnaJ-class molecular chaperone
MAGRHARRPEHGTLGPDPRKTWNPDEVKAAYRRAAKQSHPDAGGSTVEFIAAQNAWEWLRQYAKSSVA